MERVRHSLVRDSRSVSRRSTVTVDLANPKHAVARSGAVRETGLRARGIPEQFTRDKFFYREVLSAVASLDTPDCKGFSPELLQNVRTALHDGFDIKKDYDGAQDPDFVESEATGRLPCRTWRVDHRGKRHFPTNVGTVFGHSSGTGLCASPEPQGLELRGPSQLRLFLHGLFKNRGGRNHTGRAQRIHRDLHRVEAGHGKMAQRSREQGCRAPQDEGRRNNQGTSHHRPQALRRQRRRRIARACCLAAPFRPHQQHPRLDGLRQRDGGGSTRRR